MRLETFLVSKRVIFTLDFVFVVEVEVFLQLSGIFKSS
jgi:hypothetical protein